MNITVSNGLDGLMASVRKQVESSWERVSGVAEEAAQFGAQTAKSYTRSRPGATTGKGGRVEGGDMVDALSWKPISFSADLVETQYGFVEEMQDYFKYQTVTGFNHNRSGNYIAPTFALRDSIGPTREYAIAAARQVLS